MSTATKRLLINSRHHPSRLFIHCPEVLVVVGSTGSICAWHTFVDGSVCVWWCSVVLLLANRRGKLIRPSMLCAVTLLSCSLCSTDFLATLSAETFVLHPFSHLFASQIVNFLVETLFLSFFLSLSSSPFSPFRKQFSPAKFQLFTTTFFKQTNEPSEIQL